MLAQYNSVTVAIRWQQSSKNANFQTKPTIWPHTVSWNSFTSMHAVDNFGQMHSIPHLQQHDKHKHVCVISSWWQLINGEQWTQTYYSAYFQRNMTPQLEAKTVAKFHPPLILCASSSCSLWKSSVKCSVMTVESRVYHQVKPPWSESFWHNTGM